MATISPLMAEELVAMISESSGKVVEATTSSRLVNNCCGPVEEELDEAAMVLCPLGYIQTTVGKTTQWAMIDSGSMVNLIPDGVVRSCGLSYKKAWIGLRGVNGSECNVLGVLEDEEIMVAKAGFPLSFLVTKGTDMILGRPFLFASRAPVGVYG